LRAASVRSAYIDELIPDILEGRIGPGRVSDRLDLDLERHESRLDDIVVVLPNRAHSFVISCRGPLRHVDIHPSLTFRAEWIDDRSGKEKDD
jgi:hypothetical protein